jgi:hypothetical protein
MVPEPDSVRLESLTYATARTAPIEKVAPRQTKALMNNRTPN